MRWLIVADDLTGAADCAIAFARRGFESVVTWGEGARIAPPVLSVDADSRGRPPAEAVRRQLATQAAHWQPQVRLYKKIDSTLRGQPAAELVAQLSALAVGGRPPLAIVAPAFPATGRTTSGGRVLVNGAQLEETPLWARDHTYLSASLPDALASAGLTAEAIPLDTVRAGADAVHARMADVERRDVAAVVCDCAADPDLDVIAAASLRLKAAVWVGSAGLAHALAALEGPPGTPSLSLPQRGGAVLTVVGSLAEISRLQARTLVDRGLVQHVAVNPAALLAGPTASGWRTAQRSLTEGLAAGRDVLVEITATPDPDLARGPELVARLATLVQPSTPRIGALVATGGETACALLSEFGVHGIRLVEEVAPGVPFGVTLGAVSIPVVTKAGGFGDAEALCRCLARLKS